MTPYQELIHQRAVNAVRDAMGRHGLDVDHQTVPMENGRVRLIVSVTVPAEKTDCRMPHESLAKYRVASCPMCAVPCVDEPAMETAR